jgi:pimeloyl-ACP methyl ester carboxylesterase
MDGAKSFLDDLRSRYQVIILSDTFYEFADPMMVQLGRPTLVLWGDLDLPHLQARCETLVDRIPGAQRMRLEGTAHLPSLEAPERFNPVLADFLAGLGPQAAA